MSHRNLTNSVRTLKAKTVDTFDKGVIFLQAYVEELAIMELRRRKNRGQLTGGAGKIQSYVVVTYG